MAPRPSVAKPAALFLLLSGLSAAPRYAVRTAHAAMALASISELRATVAELGEAVKPLDAAEPAYDRKARLKAYEILAKLSGQLARLAPAVAADQPAQRARKKFNEMVSAALARENNFWDKPAASACASGRCPSKTAEPLRADVQAIVSAFHELHLETPVLRSPGASADQASPGQTGSSVRQGSGYRAGTAALVCPGGVFDGSGCSPAAMAGGAAGSGTGAGGMRAPPVVQAPAQARPPSLDTARVPPPGDDPSPFGYATRHLDRVGAGAWEAIRELGLGMVKGFADPTMIALIIVSFIAEPLLLLGLAVGIVLALGGMASAGVAFKKALDVYLQSPEDSPKKAEALQSMSKAATTILLLAGLFVVMDRQLVARVKGIGAGTVKGASAATANGASATITNGASAATANGASANPPKLTINLLKGDENPPRQPRSPSTTPLSESDAAANVIARIDRLKEAGQFTRRPDKDLLIELESRLRRGEAREAVFWRAAQPEELKNWNGPHGLPPGRLCMLAGPKESVAQVYGYPGMSLLRIRGKAVPYGPGAKEGEVLVFEASEVVEEKRFTKPPTIEIAPDSTPLAWPPPPSHPSAIWVDTNMLDHWQRAARPSATADAADPSAVAFWRWARLNGVPIKASFRVLAETLRAGQDSAADMAKREAAARFIADQRGAGTLIVEKPIDAPGRFPSEDQAHWGRDLKRLEGLLGANSLSAADSRVVASVVLQTRGSRGIFVTLDGRLLRTLQNPTWRAAVEKKIGRELAADFKLPDAYPPAAFHP